MSLADACTATAAVSQYTRSVACARPKLEHKGYIVFLWRKRLLPLAGRGGQAAYASTGPASGQASGQANFLEQHQSQQASRLLSTSHHELVHATAAAGDGVAPCAAARGGRGGRGGRAVAAAALGPAHGGSVRELSDEAGYTERRLFNMCMWAAGHAAGG